MSNFERKFLSYVPLVGDVASLIAIVTGVSFMALPTSSWLKSAFIISFVVDILMMVLLTVYNIIDRFKK